MSTGGWWDAWTALVSVGWVLLFIAVGAFFAGRPSGWAVSRQLVGPQRSPGVFTLSRLP